MATLQHVRNRWQDRSLQTHVIPTTRGTRFSFDHAPRFPTPIHTFAQLSRPNSIDAQNHKDYRAARLNRKA
jgi:hypothetical protein